MGKYTLLNIVELKQRVSNWYALVSVPILAPQQRIGYLGWGTFFSEFFNQNLLRAPFSTFWCARPGPGAKSKK